MLDIIRDVLSGLALLALTAITMKWFRYDVTAFLCRTRYRTLVAAVAITWLIGIGLVLLWGKPDG